MKVRIARHGNDDLIEELLCNDCASSAPTGVRLLHSVCAMHKWALVKLDAKPAFLQTGSAQHGVYVIPPFESDDKRWFV